MRAIRQLTNANIDSADKPIFQVPEIIAKELANHLEDQIIFGELAPGERIVEEDIVQRFCVSRSPVREALRMLEQEGLAVRESRRGVWVTPIGLDDLDDVYACRLVLEGLATELAAQNCVKEDLEAIRAAIESLRAIDGGGNIRDFFRQNLLLATSIHTAARNTTLKRLLGSVGKQAHRYRYLAYSHIPEMRTASVQGHEEILASMEKGNARHARILMEDMIQRSWKAIREHFLRNSQPRPAPID
jgi:DNA-binding GntR family transcriptional regulator